VAAVPAPRQTPSPLGEAELERLRELQKRIGIQFRKQELLREAMTHASWNNEHGEPAGPGHDNERLEYLGDAVLELVVGEYLFRRFPTYDEGQLTQLRAALVNTTSLARLGERLELGETLLMGRGAVKTGARKLPSLLANAFEAMIGAIFLDQGYRAATKVFLQNIGDLAEWSDENFKGQLQQASQDRTGDTPHYRVIATGGPGHKREYTAEVLLGERVGGMGRGPTKQAAEQAAARDALDKLSKTGRGGAAAAVGAARDAARTVASEPARVRRRVAEVAADRGATPRRRRGRSGARPADAPVTIADTSAPRRSRSLLSTLRHAAEALVGRQQAAPTPPAPEAAAPAPRRRRGRRGGRGRGGGSTPTVEQ
jgi:ribonuclease III